MVDLGWGRRYLMCPPEHFEVAYAINPWMLGTEPVDPVRAMAQWEALVGLLRTAGADIEVLDPVEGLPDLVFTANAGLVDATARRFVPARFRNPERQGETPHDVAWFEAHGWTIDELPTGVSHEGAGDALPFGGTLLGGWRWRTDEKAHVEVSRKTGVPLQLVALTDERFYHLDMTFSPLDDRHAMTVPALWDPADAKAVAALVPEPLELTLEEALRFTANSVVVGRNVVMSGCPPRVGRQLERWGFEVEVADVSEFLKAGGGVRCLTLALDVVLAPGPAPTTPAAT